MLVATRDLMGFSQLAGLVKLAGFEPIQVHDPAKIQAGADIAAVLVDLGGPGDGLAAVETAHRAGLPVFALGPHVQTELLEAARAKGATEVLPHSAARSRLPALLEATRQKA